MNWLKFPISTLAIILSLFTANAQNTGAKKIEQDFEKYKQEREFDYQKFKKQRAEELKRMQQEYQDYYNTMMGLKSYYTEKNDTAKANVVDDIIKFEESITYALGNRIKITEQVSISPTKNEAVEATENKITEPYIPSNTNKQPGTETKNDGVNPANITNGANPGTTLKPHPTDGDAIPILTPVPKTKSKITSPFGIRMHPTLHRPIKHNGVDFGSGRNAPVYASGNGRVVLAEYNRSYGNYIVIEHCDGTSSLYAHLDRIVTTKGNRVSKGNLIGYTGSTGRSTGAHLHYEVRIAGTPVNPVEYLKETKP
ncbi:MAG: M23 family metallopeptidase [Bacteroidales bacterium]|nr:M23 family metallopeptidase [Bacteroidales bacterium]